MSKTKLLHGLRLALSFLPIASIAHAHSAPVDAWELAQREDCAQSYTQFVLENPDSPHVTEALCRIEALETLAANVTSRAATAMTPGMRSADGASRLMNI